VLLFVGWEPFKGSNMSLHSYALVVSLQESEEYLTFEDLLKPDEGTYRIDQEKFDGFSFVNHCVPQWYIGQPDECKNQVMVS
jgi:hypothetical protein